MASSLAKLASLRASRSVLPLLKSNGNTIAIPVRNKVYRETGALLEKPVHVKLGLLKVAATVTPFLLTGGYLSREFAALLEEHELFVPDDDDDD